MAFGILSGKYRNGIFPEKSRLKLFPRMSRYSSQQSFSATEEYASIAEKYGISLAQLSLAFVNDRPFVTSNIIGATTMLQLEENINSINIKLSDEIITEINSVHNRIPNPAP